MVGFYSIIENLKKIKLIGDKLTDITLILYNDIIIDDA